MQMELLLFLIIGGLAGFSAGLLGIGGGLIMVPALAFLLPFLHFDPEIIMHMAIATSLVAIVPTAMMSAYRHSRHQAINWRYAWQLTPGLIIGAIAGAMLVIHISRTPLQIIFSIFLLLISLYMILGQPLPRADKEGSRCLLNRLISLLIGGISALLGVGGGTMTVPFLVWRGQEIHIAVGTSAFCGIPIAITAATVFFLFNQASASAAGIGYIYWPGLLLMVVGSMFFTPLGARLAHQLSTSKLKRIFAALLIFVAFSLLLDAF
ncbi:MAG: sulfite exporter TauE/SafE family protein [Gammaproteobacteria bacterium]|nr:sulfite exporter TauE/SafE family protein [Gammaproteobacteria bacterium]